MKQNDKELVKWCQTEARTKETDAYVQPASQKDGRKYNRIFE